MTTHSPFVLQSIEKATIISLCDTKTWKSLVGWEISEIIQKVMADVNDNVSEEFLKQVKKFNDAVIYDKQKELKDSFEWLNKYLSSDNPLRLGIEMQYNVFFKQGKYK